MAKDITNGFISNIWGPTFWFTLHCISLNFPLHPTYADKQHYRTFFESLQYVLPCGICRDNFKQNLEQIGYDPSVHYESRAMFSYLVYELHQIVRSNQQKSVDMTYVECCDFYEQFRATSCVKRDNDQEGGCESKKKLQCTIHVEPHKGLDEECRYTIDPLCSIIKTNAD